MNVFRHVDTAFTARHIVSAASSETGIVGALQHHVLFIRRENGGRYKSVEGTRRYGASVHFGVMVVEEINCK